MEQLKRRKQKLVAALMAATTLSGGKTAPPAAAMSQGLKKITANEKIGVPKWAKYLMIGGASVVGAAAIAGTIWCCLKDKNKNPQDPEKKNGEIPVKPIQGSKKANIKFKINFTKKKNQKKLDTIIEEKESDEEDNNEKIEQQIPLKKDDQDAQDYQEDFTIVYNTNEAEENEKKQKEAEEKAKRKAEEQENVNAFYGAVKNFHLLNNFMDALKNYNQHPKSVVGIYKQGKLYNDTNSDSQKWALGMYKDFKKNIKVNGKKIKIELLKNEPNNVDYKIIFDDDMYYNIVILGYKQMAIKELGTEGVLFEFENDIT